MMKSKSAKATKEVALTAVLSAAYAAAIMLVIIPSPTGGYTQIGDFVVFVAALLFGYRVGGAVGVIGAVVVDLFTGYPRWFVSIPAHLLEGFVPGLAKNQAFCCASCCLRDWGFLDGHHVLPSQYLHQGVSVGSCLLCKRLICSSWDFDNSSPNSR